MLLFFIDMDMKTYTYTYTAYLGLDIILLWFSF